MRCAGPEAECALAAREIILESARLGIGASANGNVTGGYGLEAGCGRQLEREGVSAILQRRATPEERAAFEADYSERLLNPYVAAERGYVDRVILPSETRGMVVRALRALRTKRASLPPKKHGNIPL